MARSAKPGRKAKGKKKGSVTVDMGGVESGGRTIRDGWATAKIVDAELTEAKDSGNEMFKITMEVVNGKQKAKVWDNLVLTPNALWKLKTLLEAAGVEVPDSEMDLSADDLLDLEFEVDIVNEEFEGKDRPKVASFAALGTNVDGDSDSDDEDDEDDDEDEKPAKSKKKSSKKDDDDRMWTMRRTKTTTRMTTMTIPTTRTTRMTILRPRRASPSRNPRTRMTTRTKMTMKTRRTTIRTMTKMRTRTKTRSPRRKRASPSSALA